MDLPKQLMKIWMGLSIIYFKGTDQNLDSFILANSV